MNPIRLLEITRFYRALIPRLRNDKAALNRVERDQAVRAMGDLIDDAQPQTKESPH